MKQTIKSLLFVLLAVIVGTTACNKDENGGEAALTAPLCWKWTKAEEYNPVSKAWVDVTADEIDPCDVDDCYKFSSDKSVTKTNGPIKCGSNEPATETGAWNIGADGKTFTLTSPNGDEAICTIIELSSRKFVFERSSGGVATQRTTLEN